MKYLLFPLAVFWAWLMACSPRSYQLHIGEPFPRPAQQPSGSNTSAIALARPDTAIVVTGAYDAKNLFLGKYPIIRLYSKERGKYLIPLSSRMDCRHGSLVRVTGIVINLPVTYELLNKTLHYNFLESQSFYILSDNQQIIDQVTEEYQKIRAELQKKLTIEDSKLQLSSNAEWQIWYDERKQELIFSSQQADLMYAADIDFVVDARTGRIKEVFANEWFKGE